MTARAEYIAGLRQLADILEANDDVPLPYHGNDVSMSFFCSEGKEQIAAFARAMPGRLVKEVRDERNYGFELHGSIRGLKFGGYAHRDEVCRRVVTGTHEETVTEQIVAGYREVTKTVEDIEWICEPLLAEPTR